MGLNLLKATAYTKALNFTSNIAALLFFVVGGQVVWIVGLVMAVGQVIGGTLGSRMTMRHEPRIVRPLLIAISFAITTKIVWSSENHVIRRWIEMVVG